MPIGSGSVSQINFNLPLVVMDLDAGTAFSGVQMVRGETRTVRIQVAKSGRPQDVTGMVFTFAAKRFHYDTVQAIGPITGTVDDQANGLVSFVIDNPQAVFNGVCEIAMIDPDGRKLVLTPPRGATCKVDESIV
jgi:hypothetical protein